MVKPYYSICCLLLLIPSLFAQNATTPGTVLLPNPTVTNLAVEWLIEGDANLDCSVEVAYRKKGEEDWNGALPLRRVPADENLGFSWKNKLSGSLFNLRPATEYEIKLSLSDPDGGSADTILSGATRPVPRIEEGMEIIDIEPGMYTTLNVESGTAKAPKIYRSNDGNAVYDYINLSNREWVYLWGLTIKSSGENSARALRMDGARNCVVRYCIISGVNGITAYGKGITDCYIGDNIITGTTGWSNATMGADGNNEGEGIQFTGSGNVICHNRVTGFRDCISTMEDDEASEQICIDIYNNDVFTGADDGIEADFCFNNCRVFQNRITNCYVGVSSQPGLGGPTYFIRNVMYNVVHAAFKFKRNSRGDVALHNTVVKVGAGLAGNDAMDFAYFRNNLAIGGPTGGVDWGGYGAGNPYAADIRDPGEHSSFDYDAVGVYGTNYVAKIGGKPFDDVEPHGIGEVELGDVFNGVAFPNPPVPERDTADLRPVAGCAVIDKGCRLPNVNDAFLGAGPDIGAYEAGQKMPIYGPRPVGVDEGTALVKARNYRKSDRHQIEMRILTAAAIISYPGVSSGNVKFSVFDAAGRRVAGRITTDRERSCNQKLDIGSWQSGWYCVTVQTDNWTASQSMLIIR